MKSCKPVRTTIVYGILCGLLYMPLTMLLMPLFSWSVSFCLIIWLYLAVYALLLAGWGRKNPSRIIFPLLLHHLCFTGHGNLELDTERYLFSRQCLHGAGRGNTGMPWRRRAGCVFLTAFRTCHCLRDMALHFDPGHIFYSFPERYSR